MIPEERRLTDDRVLIITIVLVRGLTLRNLLIVVGIALYGTKVSNPYTEQVVRRIIPTSTATQRQTTATSGPDDTWIQRRMDNSSLLTYKGRRSLLRN